MINIDKLRRLAQAAISKMDALDPEFVSSVTPLAISELLDRLEAAEQTGQDYMRIDKEKAQLAQRLEAVEGELETERMRLVACSIAALGYFEGCIKEYTSASLDDVLNLHKQLEAAETARDALRAKIAEMEKQEPVAKVESWTNGSYTRHYKLKWLRDVGEGAALYALPGAQPKPDCGEAGHDEGRCGNRQCLPGAQTQGEEK